MKYLYFLLVLILLTSCEVRVIDGLWLVTEVKVGSEVMTPDSKWFRFSQDGTLQSGNGWRQHTIGTYRLSKQKLEMHVSNGINEDGEPFSVSIKRDAMYWNHLEEGQEVAIKLVRTLQIPQTTGDQLLGLWKVESSGQTFHFRWDNVFVVSENQNQRYGVYKVHGHKPEVELIYYGDTCVRQWWSLNFIENHLQMKQLSSESKELLRLKRITSILN